MFRLLSHLLFRALALLQLTRAALAFTAIADAWTILLLRPPEVATDPMIITMGKMAVTGVVSFGLYAFGMSLNDLLDARRDRIFAPRRPIPSGRIPPRFAIVVCIGLLIMALLAAAFLTPFHIMTIPSPHTADFIPWPLLFAAVTAGLIVLYDATSKYLGGFGLLTLGVIRAVHCLVGQPRTPLLFLSMILLTHVAIVSTIAYKLENKRPRLKVRDFAAVIAGLVVGNALALGYMALRGSLTPEILPMLWGPAIAAGIYILWATFTLARQNLSPRQKGERLMLLGLFWLFLYDASILLANRQPLASLAVALLLVCAIASFFALRYLSRALGGARGPTYRSDRTPRAAATPTSRQPS
jgi:4-hydroxybenzoate polyprenyltransferase